MNELLTSIYNKTSGSLLSDDVGGRIYLDRAPEGAAFPYVVFFIVSDTPEKTFTEDFENILIQFSLFSASDSMVEITSMYAHLKALFDECSLTIPPTGTVTDILVWMKRVNLTTMVDNVTIQDASINLKHWAVDYEIMTEAV